MDLKADKCLIQGKYLKPPDLDDGSVEITHSIFREDKILKKLGHLSVSFYLQKESHPKFIFLGQ